jgi:hypothetical protein
MTKMKFTVTTIRPKPWYVYALRSNFSVSNLGGKYPVVVEFAPFQGVPKKTRRRKDIKSSTIEKGIRIRFIH